MTAPACCAEHGTVMYESPLIRGEWRCPQCLSAPVPSPADLRSFLKENAVIVAPGETLVIRVPGTFTPQHVRELQGCLNFADEDGPLLPFRSVIVPGNGFAVVQGRELRDALRDVVREEIRHEIRQHGLVNYAKIAKDLGIA